MHINTKNTNPRRVDETLKIFPHFSSAGFAFDVAEGELDGLHPKLVNWVSDRIYNVLSGAVEITVQEQTHLVSHGSIVVVPKGTAHGLNGKMRYLIITSPRFDSKNEELAGR